MHQSIGTPLIGMSQDGSASFGTAFLDELSVIMDWAFDDMQRDGGDNVGDHETHWLRDETGGSVYLRLSTRPVEQPGATARSMPMRLSRRRAGLRPGASCAIWGPSLERT